MSETTKIAQNFAIENIFCVAHIAYYAELSQNLILLRKNQQWGICFRDLLQRFYPFNPNSAFKIV